MKFLLVVDMQNDFIDGVLGSESAKQIFPSIVAKVDKFDGFIIATQDTHNKNYLETQEGKNLPVPHCIKYTWGWNIPKVLRHKIMLTADHKFITKGTFGSVELIGFLKTYYDHVEPHSVEIVGLLTDVCVVSNALLLKANFPEWEIIVDGSCCAGSSEENHRAALKVLESCQVEVI